MFNFVTPDGLQGADPSTYHPTSRRSSAIEVDHRNTDNPNNPYSLNPSINTRAEPGPGKLIQTIGQLPYEGMTRTGEHFQVYHICRVCKSPRSIKFHNEHPTQHGQPLIQPSECRRCAKANFTQVDQSKHDPIDHSASNTGVTPQLATDNATLSIQAVKNVQSTMKPINWTHEQTMAAQNPNELRLFAADLCLKAADDASEYAMFNAQELAPAKASLCHDNVSTVSSNYDEATDVEPFAMLPPGEYKMVETERVENDPSDPNNIIVVRERLYYRKPNPNNEGKHSTMQNDSPTSIFRQGADLGYGSSDSTHTATDTTSTITFQRKTSQPVQGQQLRSCLKNSSRSDRRPQLVRPVSFSDDVKVAMISPEQSAADNLSSSSRSRSTASVSTAAFDNRHESSELYHFQDARRGNSKRIGRDAVMSKGSLDRALSESPSREWPFKIAGRPRSHSTNERGPPRPPPPTRQTSHKSRSATSSDSMVGHLVVITEGSKQKLAEVVSEGSDDRGSYVNVIDMTDYELEKADTNVDCGRA